MSTHYSLGQKPKKLAEWAAVSASMLRSKLTARNQHHRCAEGSIKLALCYRGMSGIAHATALALAWYDLTEEELGMIYVRKPGEDTHGEMIEHNLSAFSLYNMYLPVFVDDFIDSGKTKEVTLNNVFEHFEHRDQHLLREAIQVTSQEEMVEHDERSLWNLNIGRKLRKPNANLTEEPPKATVTSQSDLTPVDTYKVGADEKPTQPAQV